MLILSKSAFTNNGRERRMSADSIPGRLHNLPFTREHIPMRNLVASVAQINARHGFFLNIRQRKRAAARGFQSMTPKLVFAHDGASLEQMAFGPSHRFGSRGE